MEIVFVLQKIESGLAFLKSEDGNLSVSWPATVLPNGSNIGSKLSFLVSLDEVEKARRSQTAKDILNEILD